MIDAKMKDATPARLSFSLPLEPPRLLRARHRIRDYLDSHGVAPSQADNTVLAIEEAMTNAVRHSRAEENLEVRLAFVGSGLYVEVRDHGVGFDVQGFDRDASPDPLAVGGRGLYLMIRLMDAVELRSGGDGLSVQMLMRDVFAGGGEDDPHESAILEPDTLAPDLSFQEGSRRTIVEEIEEGFAALDWEYRFIYANDFSLRMYGMRRDQVLGRLVWELFPYLRDNDLGRALRDAMEYGRPSIIDYESPHLQRTLENRVYPTRAGLSFYARDVTERRRRERERDELFEALQTSEERFRSLSGVLRASEERFRVALQNAPVSVAAQDLDLVYIWAYNQRIAPPGGIVGLRDADIFTAEEAAHITAVKSRVIAQDEEHREQIWLDGPSGRRFYDVTWAPLRDEGGRVVGVSSATVDLTKERLALDKLQEQSRELRAQSVELRAQADQLLASRERLDEELARTRLLQDVGEAASSGLDVKVLAERTLGALRQHLQLKGGDVRRVEGDSLRLLAAFDCPEENLKLVESVDLRTSELLGARAVCAGAVLTHEDETHSPEQGRILDGQSVRSDRYVYVPIEHRREVVGLLSLTFSGRRSFRSDELYLFRAVAGALGQAMSNAGLYEEQRRIAASMQRTLLRPLPEIPGLELASRSLTPSSVELLGGDFSDVSRLPDGRALVVMGDVAGKGIEVTGMAEMARTAIRAFASVDDTPAFILGKTNELLAGSGRRDPFVAAMVCVVDPGTGGVDVGSAGHPPPVLLTSSACRVLEPPFGPPLGAFAAGYRTSRLTLERGDTLVLCTDGVTEARRGAEFFGEQRLVAAVAGLRGLGAGDLAEGVFRAAVDFSSALSDDLQILVVRRV